MKIPPFVASCVLLALMNFACSDDGASGQGKAARKNAKPGIQGPQVLMVIAPGNFRDEELKVPKELLEEAGYSVKIASTVTEPVTGMLGAEITPEVLLKEVKAKDYKAVVFVGGSGAVNLFDNEEAHRLAKEAVELNRVLGAICIAPVILVKAGLVKGKPISVHDSMAELCESKGSTVVDAQVTVKDRIVTGNGPDASERFAEELLTLLE